MHNVLLVLPAHWRIPLDVRREMSNNDFSNFDIITINTTMCIYITQLSSG